MIHSNSKSVFNQINNNWTVSFSLLVNPSARCSFFRIRIQWRPKHFISYHSRSSSVERPHWASLKHFSRFRSPIFLHSDTIDTEQTARVGFSFRVNESKWHFFLSFFLLIFMRWFDDAIPSRRISSKAKWAAWSIPMPMSTSELCCFFAGEESIRCNFWQ